MKLSVQLLQWWAASAATTAAATHEPAIVAACWLTKNTAVISTRADGDRSQRYTQLYCIVTVYMYNVVSDCGVV